MSEEIIVRVGKTIYFDSFPSRCSKMKYTLLKEIMQEKLTENYCVLERGQAASLCMIIRQTERLRMPENDRSIWSALEATHIRHPRAIPYFDLVCLLQI
jgi:hypothetical protein